MLNEAVQTLKGVKVAEDFPTLIDLDVDAFIPPAYIVNEVQKLDIYKRIAGIESVKERDDMKDELLDRFGEIPKSVDNLLRIALIRVAAHKLYMTDIKGKNEKITFLFRPDAEVNPAKIPRRKVRCFSSSGISARHGLCMSCMYMILECDGLNTSFYGHPPDQAAW